MGGGGGGGLSESVARAHAKRAENLFSHALILNLDRSLVALCGVDRELLNLRSY